MSKHVVDGAAKLVRDEIVDHGRAISGGIERRYRGPPLSCQSTTSLPREGSRERSRHRTKTRPWPLDNAPVCGGGSAASATRTTPGPSMSALSSFAQKSKFASNELTEVDARQQQNVGPRLTALLSSCSQQALLVAQRPSRYPATDAWLGDWTFARPEHPPPLHVFASTLHREAWTAWISCELFAIG